MEVPVLDATAIGVSMARGDYYTAGSVMFLLGIGELLEDRNNKKLLSKISNTLKSDDKDTFTLKQHLLNDDKPPEFPVAKGVIELSNLVGTVIGLAWIASELSNYILHPLMRMLGFEKKPQ